ncbi:OLC1v1012894C3 [Oldenlandia corymbosa var. corymbosa]|uniref:5-formyltetrahydrofolate cyclo-ligase n=1 Tax=Oldenlandia corymbosa var. corymbosa TaxID=529605 RepID=A0AAV1DYW6_OLDCO|nr:OLC1v1012894C3 [Oldenlandia corymbosa var. corymbosa]
MTLNGLRQMVRHLLPSSLHHCPLRFSTPPPLPNKFGLCLTRPITARHPHPPPLSPPAGLSSAANMSTTTSTTSDSSDLGTIINQKKALRTKVRRALRSMDPNLRSQEDEAIQNLVLQAPWFKFCESLCAYISCSALREVDTSKLLHEILDLSSKDYPQKRKTLYVPRVEDKNSYMRMLNITNISDLIANSMNILEPAPTDVDGNDREDVLLSDHPVDLLLLPGLAFDKSGRRLGRGGGYYDTFLTRYLERAKEKKWKRPLLVALSYSVQIMDDDIVPVTPTDVFIDAIVSPSGVIPTSAAAKERFQL